MLGFFRELKKWEKTWRGKEENVESVSPRRIATRCRGSQPCVCSLVLFCLLDEWKLEKHVCSVGEVSVICVVVWSLTLICHRCLNALNAICFLLSLSCGSVFTPHVKVKRGASCFNSYTYYFTLFHTTCFKYGQIMGR